MRCQHRGPAAEHQPHHRRAVDRERHGLAEPRVPEPDLLRRQRRRRHSRRVQVEEQEVVLQPRAQVPQIVAARGRLLFQQRVTLRADVVQDVPFAAQKPHQLPFFAGHRPEHDFIQVRQLRAAAVALPVVWVPLEHQAFARPVALQPERAQPGHGPRRGGESPLLGQLAAFVGLLQQVPWQNGDAVEDPLHGPIRPAQVEFHRRAVDFPDADRLSVHRQQTALRRFHLLVQVRLEGEYDVIGVKRLAVGEAHPAPQLQPESAPTRQFGPRFRQLRFRLLRLAIDVHQVGVHPEDHLVRGLAQREDRIEGSRLAALQEHQAPAAHARLRGCQSRRAQRQRQQDRRPP